MMLASHVILNVKDAWLAIIIVFNAIKRVHISIGLMDIAIQSVF